MSPPAWFDLQSCGVHWLVHRLVSLLCTSVPQVRKLTDDFSEGDTRANSIAYLIAFTMGFEALLR